MYCRVTDLRYKDVVNMRDGMRLGCVCDVEAVSYTHLDVYKRQPEGPFGSHWQNQMRL